MMTILSSDQTRLLRDSQHVMTNPSGNHLQQSFGMKYGIGNADILLKWNISMVVVSMQIIKKNVRRVCGVGGGRREGRKGRHALHAIIRFLGTSITSALL